ncbi:hypothetical protein IFM89_014225 [Coptis chinensis]|uniref:DUF4283 domain-containing protein n=1 Tax=Coptis chinensis TaxID=261450 RepID=A0A835H5Z7_9MAGN|nr:hypothetical protein IFM89_014225 [Coptis chinensis]
MSFPFVKNALEKAWKLKGSMDITTDRDLFYISLSTSEDKQVVFEGGPIFIAGKIFVVMPWSPKAETKCPAAPTQVWVPRTSLVREQNSSVAAPVTRSSTQDATNQNFTTPFVSEVVSSLNDAVVTRESPSTARTSARSPTSLMDAVVSRESPSTTMATVRSPSSPSLPRPIQSLSRNNEDNSSSLGPLLATPHISRLLRTSTDGSSFNCLPGNSPFSTLRNSGSPSFSRESAQYSGNTREKEVVVYTTQEQTQSVLEQEEGILTEEELFQFNVDNNAYAALVIEEDGIDDDISETHDEPFDDHIMTSSQVTRLQMPSQVVTRAQLQQQKLQSSGKRGRGRAKGSGNKGKNKR